MSSTYQDKTNSKFDQDTNLHFNIINVLTIILNCMRFGQEKQNMNSRLFKLGN